MCNNRSPFQDYSPNTSRSMLKSEVSKHTIQVSFSLIKLRMMSKLFLTPLVCFHVIKAHPTNVTMHSSHQQSTQAVERTAHRH